MNFSRWTCTVCYVFLLGVFGCSGVSYSVGGSSGKATSLSGSIHGGQQAVSGSNIQLYAVGSGANGAAAKPLLTTPVTSDDSGSFSITADYTCPVPDVDVYLVATGGNPGLASGTKNAALSMLSALGPCSQLGPGTFVQINELTTVGSLAALYPYASGYAAIGAADPNSLATAFSAVKEYTTIANGSVPGPTLPIGWYGSSVEIQTLADILSTCINSAGGVAQDGSACGTLFALAAPGNGVAPTDTIGAILNILNNPTSNVTALFNLTPARGAPFQPTLTRAPADWTLPIVPVPATPAFSEPAGVYRGSQQIWLTDSVAGASIYYTLDGSAPTTASKVYSGPITVSSPTTINAIANYQGRTSSAIASARYLVAPVAEAPAEASVTPQNSNGVPNTVTIFGNFEFVSVQATGQIFTYNISSGYQLLAVPPYSTSCTSPSGMKVTTINGITVMAVICYDTNQLLTLRVDSDGSLTQLGSVGGLPVPYPGIDLIGTDVFVPLYGTSRVANGGVAKVSLAVPTAPVVTAMVSLASPAPNEFANPAYLVASDGYLYVTAGSESSPVETSSTIQVINASSMTLVGTPFVVAHSPQQIAKYGNVVYVTLYDAAEFDSIDATDPANLIGLQVLPTNSPQCNSIPLVVNAGVAYIGCYAQNTVEQIDVSNPAAMVQGAMVNVPSPQRIVMSGTQLFVTSGTANGPVTRIDTSAAF